MVSTQQKISLLCMATVMSIALTSCKPPTFTGSGSTGGVAFSDTGLKLNDAKWGRLVDVFDVDGLLYDVDIVIREDIVADGIDYDFTINPISQKEILTILHLQNLAHTLDPAYDNPPLKQN